MPEELEHNEVDWSIALPWYSLLVSQDFAQQRITRRVPDLASLIILDPSSPD